MKLSLERNTNPETREKEPYHILVEIVSVTADVGRIYTIPVHITYMGIYKNFHVDICGVRLLAQRKPQELLTPVEMLLRNLLNGSRFPSYVFIARRAKHVYPVYTLNDEVFSTTTGGGPVFRHVELAKVREYLTDYLHRIKVLGDGGKSDKLHARGINPHTLGLRRPVLYLKKRVPGQNDFWAPVFESGDQTKIYTHAANHRRETNIDSGHEVSKIWQIVAEVLQLDKRLANKYDLRPDRLMPEYWERFKALLKREGEIVIRGQPLDLYRSPDLWVVMEPRPDEDRYGLFLGENADDIQGRVTTDFIRRGM